MIWDIDPVLIDFGALQIRYYGVLYALGIFLGYLVWRGRMCRLGYPKEAVESYLIWAVVALLIGARLGHCLFYQSDYYLSRPLEILKIWQGGLSSHGGGIATVIMLLIFHRVKRMRLIDVMDSLAMPASILAIFVRLGNFMNSEIVGRITTVPWAIKFPRYEAYVAYINDAEPVLHPRHPSQLYESLLGLVLFGILYCVDRKYMAKPVRGLLTGLFLIFYFSGRFIAEYAKEYLTLSPGFPVTMGQILSIPFILWGIGLLTWLWLKSRRQVNPAQ